jgi:hypothetical protein
VEIALRDEGKSVVQVSLYKGDLYSSDRSPYQEFACQRLLRFCVVFNHFKQEIEQRFLMLIRRRELLLGEPVASEYGRDPRNG